MPDPGIQRELEQLREASDARSAAKEREDRESQSITVRVGRVLNLQIRAKQAITITTVAAALSGAIAYTRAGDMAGLTRKEEFEATKSEVAVVKQQIVVLQRGLDDLRLQLRDQRLDQLDQWQWEARQAGDRERFRALSTRKREVNQ